MAFRPRLAGQLSAINFEHLGSPDGDSALKNLLVSVSEMADGSSPLTNASLVDIFGTDSDPRGKHYTGNFDRHVERRSKQDLLPGLFPGGRCSRA